MPNPGGTPLQRGLDTLLRARRYRARRRKREGRGARALTVVVCVLAGLMLTISALNARGTDYRPSRNTDLVSLVEDNAEQKAELAARVTELRREVDALTQGRTDDSAQTAEMQAQATNASIQEVSGPTVTVTLDDAPQTAASEGIDADLLLVHQQDIQQVVNVLWSAGAEAMTIQGKRVIATTGIKCVGNTVVLHGVPYAPPYIISAIGNQDRMQQALSESSWLEEYRPYVDAFGLGFGVQTDSEQTFEAFQGSLELQYASKSDG